MFVVSVPSRGLCFQSAGNKRPSPDVAKRGFRPLSGIMFSIDCS